MNWCGSMKTDTVGRMVVTDKTDLNKRRVSLQHVEVLAGEGVISKVERWLGGRLKDIRAFIASMSMTFMPRGLMPWPGRRWA
jgi:hypothetical protein